MLMTGTMIMRKTTPLILICSLAIIMNSCYIGEIKEDKRYTMNALHSYGGSLGKTEISYDITVYGKEEDIKNINLCEVLINMEHTDLLSEGCSYDERINYGGTPCFRITGHLIFNTANKSKEEIDQMRLLEGIRITDKDNGDVILKFKK